MWVATDRCERDLENERWSYEDVLRMLSCLEPVDFKNAERCQVKGGQMYPCDVYRLCFDFERCARKVHCGDLLMGEEILALRRRYGLTQQQASRIFGKGKIAFSRYESETSYPARAPRCCSSWPWSVPR